METPEPSGDIVFQQNIYYGIHYPAEEIPTVCEALKGSRYGTLATDEREITLKGRKFLRNVNSDDSESRGVIFPDDMSVQGDEASEPTTYCKFDPVTLTASEETYTDCVEITTDIYDIIIAYYKKNKRSVKNFSIGWCVYNCEWCDGDDSEDSPVITKNVVTLGKKSAGKQEAKSEGKPQRKTGKK